VFLKGSHFYSHCLGVLRSLGKSHIQHVGYRKSSNVDPFYQVMNASYSVFTALCGHCCWTVIISLSLWSSEYNTIQYSFNKSSLVAHIHDFQYVHRDKFNG